MTYQAVPNTAAFVVEFGSAELQWTNTFHYMKSGFLQSELETAANVLWNVMAAYYMPIVSNNFSLRKVTAYDLRSPDAPVVVFTDTPVPGSDAADTLTLQDALILTLYTNTRGRSGRGRVYFAGFTESDQTDGEFTSTVASDIATLASHLHLDLLGYGWVWVVVSRYLDGVKREEGSPIIITTYSVRSNIPGSQSRRTRRP
jgi:hypothetical protein